MAITKQELRNNLRTVIAVGVVGGVYLGLFDAITTIWRGDVRFLILGDLLRILIVPLVIYVGVCVIGMAVIGTVAFFLYRANRLPGDPLATLGFQSGVFTVFAASYLLNDLLNVRAATKPLSSLWDLIFLGLLAAAGAAAVVLMLWKYVRRPMVRWILLALPLVLLFALASADLIRAKQLPKSFFSFSHSPKRTEATGATVGKNAPSASSPNILWIVLDTARADHFSSYGYARQTTPQIDAFAKDGMQYTNVTTVSPWTFPSHAAMLTSMFPSKNGADGGWPWLGDDFTTLPEMLRGHGYRTLGYSNNDNFGPMTNLQQGFDRFSLYTKSEALEKSLLLARTVRMFLVTIHAKGNLLGLGSLYRYLTNNDPRKDFGAAQTTAEVIQHIDNARNDGVPFFSFVNLMEAHDPYGDSPDGGIYLNELQSAVGLEEARIQADLIRDDVHAYVAGKRTLSEKEQALITALYDGDVHYLDRKVGELISALKQRNIYDQTLIIVTSDHGENLGDHALIDHVYDIHRNLTRIPLIIRYPKNFSAGKTSDDLVQNIDLLPTILDITGINDVPRTEMQGLSLLGKERRSLAVSEALFVSDTFQRTRYVLPLFPGVDQRRFGGYWKSIQDGTYEYIVSPLGSVLYNIREDPGERKNLADQQPKIATELHNDLAAWQQSFPNYWDPLSKKEQ